MNFFKTKPQFVPILEKPFALEKEIQELTEQNLQAIFELEFIKSEFQIKRFRLDTVAYNPVTKAFVIIEYKRNTNHSVIDQGYAYLNLMLDNKAEFILLYNEAKNVNLKKENIDWTQSRLIFVSPQYNSYQTQLINFKDLPIELWQIKRYQNDTVSYTQLKNETALESIESLSSVSPNLNTTISNVNKTIKVFTEQDHCAKGTLLTIELYEKFRDAILSFENVELKHTKNYIAFAVNRKNITDFKIQKKKLLIWVNLKQGQLNDPKSITKDISNIGTHGNGEYLEYLIEVDSDEYFEYILSLIKQSLKENS